MTVQVQSLRVPIGTVRVNGEELPVFATNEWRRPLEEMAKLLNEQQLLIEALQARLP